MFEQVTPEEAKRRLTEQEYQERHAPEALLVPIDHLVARVGELDPERPMLVVCEHGMRSLMACRFLVQQAGFRRVTNVRGGMSVWPY